MTVAMTAATLAFLGAIALGFIGFAALLTIAVWLVSEAVDKDQRD